jgi:ABC-type glycerol-3-phosphate transport system permease component
MSSLNDRKAKWLALPYKRPRLGLAQRRRVFERGVIVFFIVYALITLFPFYILFVRTFVGTKESTQLHLWIPPVEEVNLDGQIGRLAVFFNLDLAKFKEDMGIPASELLPPRITLREVADKYDISEERMKAYFAPFSVYNGWIVLFGSGEFLPAVGRTALITILSLVGMNILAACTGYGLAGLRRKDQMLWYNLYLLRAVIPPMLVILPQFIILQWFLNLIPNYNTPGFTRSAGQLLAIVLLWVRGGALPAMLMTTAIEAIPQELEEAAEVDGANPLQYFFYILLPLMKVPMAALTVIFLPLIWNDFIHPYIYLDQNNTTILPLIQTSYSGQYASNFQVIYTGVFVSILPLVIIYLLFRRWFIQGAMAGAIKG